MISSSTIICVCFTQQCVCVLVAERWLLRCVRVLKERGIVDADVGMLGELPESERCVQVQLPALLLSTTTKVLLTHVQTNRCIINIILRDVVFKRC